jgi:signal transduction histidine kinase
LFGEDTAVQKALTTGRSDSAALGTLLGESLRELGPGIRGLEVRSTQDEPLGSARSGSSDDASDLGYVPLTIPLPIFDRATGSHVGTLRAQVSPSALMPLDRLPPVSAGMMVVLLDGTGRSLMPVPFELGSVEGRGFSWAGESWVLERRVLEEPPLELRIAATAGPFIGPFQRAARRGTLLLLVAALAAVTATALLTTRLTRSLRQLTEAAEAVSQGEFDRAISVRSRDEVGRLGRAFNRMTEHLRRTLDQLAGRESLAAVGEFAAGLAHEVRNPLTAVQIDLQHVQSQLPEESPLREPQEKALAEIRRLDATVRNALKVARSGRIEPREIDLAEPLGASADAARPFFDARGAELALDLEASRVVVIGDPGALEQLFLNLLRNAAEAVRPGGSATVEVEVGSGDVAVTVRDDGEGVSPEALERAFEPLFSTRAEGTGLGLPIAHRIAVAHGGSIEMRNRSEGGAELRVRLPLPRGSRAVEHPHGQA